MPSQSTVEDSLTNRKLQWGKESARWFSNSEQGHPTQTGDKGASVMERKEGSKEMIIPESQRLDGVIEAQRGGKEISSQEKYVSLEGDMMCERKHLNYVPSL